MAEEEPIGQRPPPPERWDTHRVTLGGDALLSQVVDTVSGGDADKRQWARAMIENEDSVARFVTKVPRALRAVREARGLSIDAAADQAGISPSTLARLETGASVRIDLKLVARVALMLGVAPRLDFADRGSGAAVSVSDAETIQANPVGLESLDAPFAASPPGFGTEGGEWPDGKGVVNPGFNDATRDPSVLDVRIRNLEARMATMEDRKPKPGD
jgi:transcriptional regulator with XRE-family HTH domain